MECRHATESRTRKGSFLPSRKRTELFSSIARCASLTMSMLSYRAVDANGRRVEDVIEAASTHAAIEKLQRAGLSRVELFEVPLKLAPQELGSQVDAPLSLDMVRLSAALARTGPGLAVVWRQVLRRARWWLVLGALLIALGLWQSNGFFSLSGVLMCVLPFALSGLSWRHASRYDRFLRAYAYGNREQMQRLSGVLRGAMKDLAMRFDLAVREAEFIAREQGLDVALAQVEPYREPLQARAPGVFAARTAFLHLAADDRSGFVRRMHEAWQCSGENPSRALDAALAEARCGDPEKARAMLDAIDSTKLEPIARILEHWLEGVLARHEGKDGREALSRALAGFSDHARLPAVWSSLAACTCDFALELARHGQPSTAQGLVNMIWPIATHHLDAATRAAIESTFPASMVRATPEH